MRSFPGHAGQVSSISFRPLQQGESLSVPQSPAISIRASATEAAADKQTQRNEGPDFDRVGSQVPTPDAEKKSYKTNTVMSNGAVRDLLSKSPGAPQSPSKGHSESTGSTKATHVETIPGETAVDVDRDKEPAQDTSLFGSDDPRVKMELESDLNETFSLPGKMGGDNDITMDDATNMSNPADTSVSAQQSIKVKDKSGIDSDGDSLFGGSSADGSAADADANADADGEANADADGEADGVAEADMDAEGEEDDDAEGEDDDQPLAARAGARAPTTPGLELPGAGVGNKASDHISANAKEPEPKDNKSTKANGTSTDTDDSKQKALPKPTFGAASVFASYDADTSKFSNDILLTSTLGGQVALWDRRVPSYPSGPSGSSNASNGAGGAALSAPHKGVRALPLPEKTPPWCMSTCWSSRGDKIYVGRRNETVDEWDLRMLPDTAATEGTDGLPTRLASSRRGNARYVRSLRFPSGSGPVSSVLAMPNGQHLVCGSFDNVRMWDTAHAEGNSSSSSVVPFRIVAGHHGGTISSMILDPTARFLFTASGDRGWYSTSTETVLMHEVRGLF